jgi:hypothetical protein
MVQGFVGVYTYINTPKSVARFLFRCNIYCINNMSIIFSEVRALEDENARLKKIIANQALELEFKTELLKKSDAHYKKAGR